MAESYPIPEVAARIGLTAHTLRYYERRVKPSLGLVGDVLVVGLLWPRPSTNGHHIARPSHGRRPRPPPNGWSVHRSSPTSVARGRGTRHRRPEGVGRDTPRRWRAGVAWTALRPSRGPGPAATCPAARRRRRPARRSRHRPLGTVTTGLRPARSGIRISRPAAGRFSQRGAGPDRSLGRVRRCRTRRLVLSMTANGKESCRYCLFNVQLRIALTLSVTDWRLRVRSRRSAA